MPRNPEHNTGWRALIATAEAELTAARSAEISAASAFASPRHRAALARLDAAKAALRSAWRAQFASIADYAAWRFAGLESSKDGFSIARDVDRFSTMEQVDLAFDHARRDALEGTLERRFRLDTGQPPELAAFASRAETISSWRRFGELDCMVSFCLAAETFHICLAHPWGALALQSNEIFRGIATQLTRESILLQLPAAAPLFNNDGHRLAQHRELIRQVNALAAKFRFYRHLLPERGLREEFCRVDMVWNGAGWIDPDWSAIVYAKLPPVLRDAAGAPALPALPGGQFLPG